MKRSCGAGGISDKGERTPSCALRVRLDERCSSGPAAVLAQATIAAAAVQIEVDNNTLLPQPLAPIQP